MSYFTATVTELTLNGFTALAVNPTGKVAFVDENGITLTTESLVDTVAVFEKPDWAAGIHTVTAYYLGDVTFEPGVSTPLTQTVNKRASTTGLTRAPNPSLFGENVTFTVTVAEILPDALNSLRFAGPTGEVAFVDERGVTLTTKSLVDGVATFDKADWETGTHTVTAHYAGDANYAASVSAPVSQVVQPKPLAVNDAAGTLQDNAVTIAVLANDLDPAGGGLTVSSITQPISGSAAIDVGNQTVTFTPAPGVAGVFTFTYVATDVNNRSDEALVSVVVSAKSETGAAPEIAPVDPGVDTTVAFSSPGVSLLSIQMPAGVFTGTVTDKDIFYLAYTPIVTPTGDINQPPSGLKFGNYVFDLGAYLNGQLLSPLTFAQPVTLTFTYSPALLSGLNEATLTVYYWNGTAWANDGITVIGRDLTNHTLTVVITHLSEFAFFAATPTAIDDTPEPDTNAWRVYLPVITQATTVRDLTAPTAPPILPAGSQPIYLPYVSRP